MKTEEKDEDPMKEGDIANAIPYDSLSDSFKKSINSIEDKLENMKPLLTDEEIFKATGFVPEMNEADVHNCEAFDAGAKYVRNVYEEEIKKYKQALADVDNAAKENINETQRLANETIKQKNERIKELKKEVDDLIDICNKHIKQHRDDLELIEQKDERIKKLEGLLEDAFKAGAMRQASWTLASLDKRYVQPSFEEWKEQALKELKKCDQKLKN